MQKLILAFLIFALVACNDKPSSKILSASSGALNNLTVVMPNTMWGEHSGETRGAHKWFATSRAYVCDQSDA